MAKPEKVRASKVAILIDGVQLKRVQTVGQSADLSKEKLLELSDTQVVQYIDNIPNVSVSIDTNDIGSVDTLKLAADSLIKRDTAIAGEIRTSGWYSQVLLAQQNTSAATDEDNFLSAKVDLTYAVSEDGTNVNRVAWMHNAALTGISWNYDVNGFGQENFTFQGDNRTWFLGQYAGVRGLILRKDQIRSMKTSHTATCQSFRLDSTLARVGAAASRNYGALRGATVVALGIDDKIFYASDSTQWRISTVSQISGNGNFQFELAYVGSGQVPYSTPYASTASGTISRVFAVIKPKLTTASTGGTTPLWVGINSANPGYNLTPVSTSIGGRSREFLTAVLYNTLGPTGQTTSTTAAQTLRLQSIGIDVSPGADPLLQLGSKSAFAYDIEEPLPLTVTVNALDSDLEIYAKLMGTAIGTGSTTVKQIRLEDFNGANSLVLKIYKNSTKTTLLKTIRTASMNVTNTNDNVTVGGNATTEITFECSNINVAGSGVKVY